MQLMGKLNHFRSIGRGISWFSTIVLLASVATVVADDYAPQVGSSHVAFTLPAIDDGRPVSLAQFRGKKVLLIQFASW
jgi:hypothetical protein